MTDSVLSLDAVSVDFGRFRALDGVSLEVRAGERVALIGHNGAGKSTLFRAVLGFLAPAAGQIRVAGHAPGSNPARVAVNYLPETVTFPRALTGTEVIRYFSGLRGAPRREAADLLERVGLSHAANRAVGTYSKGMRQRLGLAQALIGAPRLLMLDEPTSGLDPVSRRDFYEVIDAASRRGSAVLLSSHGLEEIEHQTDRVAILSHGKLRALAPLAELAAKAALPTHIRVTARPGEADRLQSLLGGTRVNGARLDLTCPAGDKLAQLSRLTAHAELVRDVDVQAPGLTDVYRFYSDADQTEDRP